LATANARWRTVRAVPPVVIVRGVPLSFASALSAAPPDPPIDVARARAQHAGYVAALRRLGADVIELPADEACPDCVFVEDTAVIAGGIALLARPGAASRQAEPAAVHAALAARLPVETMEAPATLDGGDCARLGRTLYIGRTARTSAAGAARARTVFGRVGVDVIEVPVTGALHLKSVCSPLGDDAVLVADGALPRGTFRGVRELIVPADEAPAANVVVIGRAALVAAGFPRAAQLVADAGFEPVIVDTSEMRKADGALTCLSIVLPTA
jgi:dimethylargininase